MSVLIDKSVCPHASGQQTAMHVCDERERGARAGGGGAGGLARGGTDRLVDEDGHGEVDRQYDPNSVDELNMA